METLKEQTIGSFLETLASSSPTPGGGSVAAMTGAMAAGLVSMVCALTVGKKQYAEFSAEAQAIQHQALAIQQEFQELAQADIDIFGRLSATYKLPRTTDADAASRREAIQTVTRAAADVPLRVARTAISLLPLCAPLARRGNRMVVSDIGVAVELISSTVKSSIINTEVNLVSIEDQHFVRDMRTQLEDISIGLNDEVNGVIAIVQERIHS